VALVAGLKSKPGGNISSTLSDLVLFFKVIEIFTITCGLSVVAVTCFRLDFQFFAINTLILKMEKFSHQEHIGSWWKKITGISTVFLCC